MKALSAPFGIESLLTLLIPGLVLIVSIVVSSTVLLEQPVPLEQLEAIKSWVSDAEFLAAFLVVALSALFGAVVASAQAAIETFLLDPITAKWLRRKCADYTKEAYMTDWYKYLKELNKTANPYVSRLLLFFDFEGRLGLAGFALAVSLFAHSWLCATVVLVVALFLYVMCMLHHCELGKYRRNLVDDSRSL